MNFDDVRQDYEMYLFYQDGELRQNYGLRPEMSVDSMIEDLEDTLDTLESGFLGACIKSYFKNSNS